jgi:hypothetical protein
LEKIQVKSARLVYEKLAAAGEPNEEAKAFNTARSTSLTDY